MGALQDIIIVMNRESGRYPVRVGGMAGGTGCWYADRAMVWICRLVVIGLVASHAGIRWVVVISLVTRVTVNGGMSAGQRIIVTMDREGSRCPARVCSMTGSTGGWYT